MIQITPSISIDESEIQLDFIHSSGPGGQNVNKVATGVQLRFNVDASPGLPEEVKFRLRRLARSRISEGGDLVIEAQRYRSQVQNREDALARLAGLIRQAAEKPRARVKTRPSAASKAARVDTKKRRGAVKRMRRVSPGEVD